MHNILMEKEIVSFGGAAVYSQICLLRSQYTITTTTNPESRSVMACDCV